MNSLDDSFLWVERTKRVKAEFADHLKTDRETSRQGVSKSFK